MEGRAICILGVADKRKPTEEELDKMAVVNKDGAGIAWRENGLVKWEKGLSLDEIKVLVKQVPIPFTFHFRLASCGPREKEVTHPFPIERDVRTDLTGSTKGYVLFHNGHWPAWKDRGLDGALKNKVRIPDGKWTDTRVMAWLTHLHGTGVLEFIDEKVILFGPTKIEIFHPEGWFRIENLLVSNRAWEHQYIPKGTIDVDDYSDAWDYQSHHGSYWMNRGMQICRSGSCRNDVVKDSYYCNDHQPPCRQYQCSIPRAGGTEYCANHQSLCKMLNCKDVRVVGELYCLKHLSGSSGGTPTIVPFHNSPRLVQEGADQQDEAPRVQSEVGSVGGIVPGTTPLEADTEPLAIREEEWQWAREINVKTHLM